MNSIIFYSPSPIKVPQVPSLFVLDLGEQTHPDKVLIMNMCTVMFGQYQLLLSVQICILKSNHIISSKLDCN